MNFTHLREDRWCAQTVLELPPTLAHKNYAGRTLPPERLHPFRAVFQSPFSSEGEPDAGSPVWRASEAWRAKARTPRVNGGHDGRSERPVGQHRAPPNTTAGCGAADVSSQDFFAASPPAAAYLCKVAKNSNAPRAPADPSASPKAAARPSFSAPARAPPPFSSEGEPDAGSPVWRASKARRAKARSPRVNEGHDGRSERPVG